MTGWLDAKGYLAKRMAYERGINIRGIGQLPDRQGRKYLAYYSDGGDELIAKRWEREEPKELGENEMLVVL